VRPVKLAAVGAVVGVLLAACGGGSNAADNGQRVATLDLEDALWRPRVRPGTASPSPTAR
jgi:hypothetical protein